jgi:beta-lactamase regulating signal transducer with metallopeptidase domain
MTMAGDAALDALWRAHLGLSLGLMAVLLLRKPWRRLAGAQAAYALWLLPLWLAGAAQLPRSTLPGWALPPVLVNGQAASALGALPVDSRPGLAALWLLGVLVVAAYCTALHRRYAARLATTPDGRWQAPAGDSPGLLGLWRPRLVLPADFRQRFAAAERRWILAHEAAHARRFDNPVRILATAIAALAWFNPLAWWALAALRQDQELACDAAVMQRFPGSWRRYGLALLKLDGATGLPPAATAWQSYHPLKERIMLLKNNAAPRTGARQAARAMLALGALLGLAAVQTISSAADKAPPARKFKAGDACKMSKPELPEAVAKGEYLLKVTFRVGANGHPDTVRTDGDPQRMAPLIAAVERSVRAYECKPALAGAEAQQEFMFKID